MLVRQQALAGRRRDQRDSRASRRARAVPPPDSRAPPPATIDGPGRVGEPRPLPWRCDPAAPAAAARALQSGRRQASVVSDSTSSGISRYAGRGRPVRSDARHTRRWSRTSSALRGAARDAEHTGGERRLIRQLVQHAPLLAERGAHRRGGDHEQRDGVRISLRGGGEDVGEPGTRDGERGRRAAGEARIAVGGEARTLLVAHEHMADVGGGEAAVELEVVNPGNAENRVDAVGGEQLDQVPTDAARHDALLVERSVKNRARMAWAATKSKQGPAVRQRVEAKGWRMKYSDLVKRVAGDGADAWKTHYAASAAKHRGEDVIILSVGDPDLDTPQPVIERAVERMRGGDTHYTPVAGREPLREAIAQAHARRTGQAVEADNVIFLAGAQNALFAASLCLAGPGDEVLAFEPLYPTYPATIEASGARMVRVPAQAGSGFRPDLAALEAAITPRTRAIFFATPNNPSGARHERGGPGRHRRARPAARAVDRGGRGVRGTRARRPGAEPCREPARASGHQREPVEDARDARLARRLDGRPEGADRATPRRSRSHALRPARIRPGSGAHRDRHRAEAESRMRDYCRERCALVLAALAQAPGTASACRPMPACSC